MNVIVRNGGMLNRKMTKVERFVLRRSRIGRFPAVAVPEAEASAHGVQSESAAQTGARLREESLRGRCWAQATGPGPQPHRNSGVYLICISAISLAARWPIALSVTGLWILKFRESWPAPSKHWNRSVTFTFLFNQYLHTSTYRIHFLETSTKLGAIRLERIIERVNAAMRTVVIGGRRGVGNVAARGTSSDMSQKSFVMEWTSWLRWLPTSLQCAPMSSISSKCPFSYLFIFSFFIVVVVIWFDCLSADRKPLFSGPFWSLCIQTAQIYWIDLLGWYVVCCTIVILFAAVPSRVFVRIDSVIYKLDVYRWKFGSRTGGRSTSACSRKTSQSQAKDPAVVARLKANRRATTTTTTTAELHLLLQLRKVVSVTTTTRTTVKCPTLILKIPMIRWISQPHLIICIILTFIIITVRIPTKRTIARRNYFGAHFSFRNIFPNSRILCSRWHVFRVPCFLLRLYLATVCVCVWNPASSKKHWVYMSDF